MSCWGVLNSACIECRSRGSFGCFLEFSIEGEPVGEELSRRFLRRPDGVCDELSGFELAGTCCQMTCSTGVTSGPGAGSKESSALLIKSARGILFPGV